MKWIKWPDLPGTETTASLGVSAPFAGVWEHQLIVAGGCNFPGKPVTEGGSKRYYDEIFTLDLRAGADAEWKIAGHLPHPLAYGATAITPDGMVCLGGNNNEKSVTDVFLLTTNAQQTITLTELPALPVALDNAAAAAIGRSVYVAGGNADGKPSNALYCLDLQEPAKGWQRLKDFPGPARVQPVWVAQQNGEEATLYLAGGFQPVEGERAAQVPTDLLAYSPSRKTWSEESLLPPLADGALRTLTGGIGLAYGDHHLVFAGGVNYNCFLAAVDRPRQMEEARRNNEAERLNALQTAAAEYMFHPVEWYKFNQDLLIYNTLTREWQTAGPFEPLARAGAGAVWYNQQLIVVNGELKPGVRTPQVNGLTLTEEF
ncbi:cyclically-permuted mutarotase family protein [Parabacteroides sp. PF5-6]|uniref:cyclically-permuted mutarotase family protein n=1 Tax=Parabacteroides sp. PF5-6 TaxID=1742403 RepID=UPI0024076CDF|nr:cyclically-permuted mutarotase family protein [Parabacteroides sp. PF5-6]